MMLRGAFLGAGNIAQHGHLPAYLNDPQIAERCAIVAAADLSRENLQQLVAHIPKLAIYERASDLLAEVRPDFVDICAPPHVHRDLIEQAAGYGCHILCEKPLGLTLADAEAVQSRLQNLPLVFVPGHQYHYAPIWQAVSGAIRRDAIGIPHLAEICIQRLRANDGNPHWRPAWRTKARLGGGGILMDHGAHLFYQLQSVFGRPQRVMARIESRRHFDYEVEDTAYCHLDFGVTQVYLDLSWAAACRLVTHRYVGPAGEILCNDDTLLIRTGRGEHVETFEQGFSSSSDHSIWYQPLLRDFFDRIERSDFDRAPLEEAISALHCAVAAYEAASSGRPVTVRP